MDAGTRAALEVLYRALLSAIVLLARALGKEYPLVTRETRRRQARELFNSLDNNRETW